MAEKLLVSQSVGYLTDSTYPTAIASAVSVTYVKYTAPQKSIYIDFDISELPTMIKITKATLNIDLAKNISKGAMYVYGVSGAWDGSALTYNNQPASSLVKTVPHNSIKFYDGTGAYVPIDMTAYFTDVINGSKIYNGLMFKYYDGEGVVKLNSVASGYESATLVIEYEFLNKNPLVSLSTTNNRTLYENDTFNIGGTTSDADNGNTVTIRYQINAETVRSIKAFVSDGTTVESFSKSLVFKSGKLYDGETAITGNLTDGVAHKLKVWATDDQGGTSTIVERDFYVVPNRAPSLTVDPPIISGNIDNDKFTINGSYNDADDNTTTVKYRINGGNSVQVASGTSGAFDFEVSFAQLTTGPNVIVVEAIDSYGAKTSKTVKLNKNVVSTEQLRSTARYKIIPPNKSAQAVLLWIERDKDLAIEVAINMTMVGEAESFVPVTVSESVPIAAGSNTYEDTFFYEADAPKDNILVQIDMTRQSVDADDNITLISGVLE